MPSLNEIVEGLINWMTRQVEGSMAGKSKNLRKALIRSNRRNFKTIFDGIKVSPEDMDKPLTKGDGHSVLDTYNPYSKVTCIVLYLYSMEIGTPQLYAEVNRVARDMDLTYLKEFGPFLRALTFITASSESRKNETDKVTPGNKLGGVDINMAGSFLLFRGAAMKNEWVAPYISEVGKRIMLPGNNSCSKDLTVALNFAVPKVIQDQFTPTLFVIACRNYRGFNGMVMNNEAYSSYPSESEVLLMEGCDMWILAVDHNVKLPGINEGKMATYNDKVITVVHLFQDG